MSTTATATALATEHRTIIELKDAEPITSWPVLSGNRFIPTMLIVTVETDWKTGRRSFYVAAQTGHYGDPTTERWWSSDAATRGPHDLRFVPAWMRTVIRGTMPDLHLPARS